MEFSSKLLQNAVNEVAQLPGIEKGRRTALRLVLHLFASAKRIKQANSRKHSQRCGLPLIFVQNATIFPMIYSAKFVQIPIETSRLFVL